jgi:hypothetical protein
MTMTPDPAASDEDHLFVLGERLDLRRRALRASDHLGAVGGQPLDDG